MGIIQEEKIFLNQSLTTQKEVFEFLANQAVETGISADEKQVYQRIVERENEGTTGMMALFIPDIEAGTTHLKLLSAVARLLMRNEVTEKLKAAQSKAEIATLLNEKIGENE